jgi:hypothetical protein
MARRTASRRKQPPREEGETTMPLDMITDSVTQANTKVLGDSPAVATGNLFVATSQALSNAAHNATGNQQNSYVTMLAATSQGVSTLLTSGTGSAGSATADIDRARAAAGRYYR